MLSEWECLCGVCVCVCVCKHTVLPAMPVGQLYCTLLYCIVRHGIALYCVVLLGAETVAGQG